MVIEPRNPFQRGQFDGCLGFPGATPMNQFSLEQAVDGFCQGIRSEEHTSELQSLMRISYAVFCLKKKKKTKSYTNILYNERTSITQIHIYIRKLYKHTSQV